MGNFQVGRNRDGGFRSSSRPSFNKNRGGGGRDRERTMHTAVCSQCGKTCEVPFRPTGEKPVYCRECFSEKREQEGGRDFESRGPRKNFGERPRFENNLKPAKETSGLNEETKRQLVEITSKLDRLITVVEKLASAPRPIEASPKVAEKAIETKVPVKKKTATKVVKKKK